MLNGLWNSAQALQTLATICLVLTAVSGVIAAGAGFIGSWAGNRAADIQKAESDERVALAQQGAAEANAQAQIANAEAAKANEEVQTQKRKTAEIEQQAAQLRLDAERLKQTVAWRELSPAEVTKLAACARRHGPAQLNLRYVNNDPEALALAIQFKRAFEVGGWHVGMGSVQISGLAFGVIVDLSSQVSTANLEHALSECQIKFVRENVPVGIGFMVTNVAGPTLIIGSKPR